MKRVAAVFTAAIVSTAFHAAAQTDGPKSPAWITATNQPCKIWNPEPEPDESVTWSGSCTDGFASGHGVLQWTENGKPDAKFEGDYANGKRNGHGILTTPGGDHIEGVWVNDQLLSPGDSDAI